MDLFFGRSRPPLTAGEWVQVGERAVPILFVRHPRARRYVLRLRADGTARVSVPRRGSLAEARAFVENQVAWLGRQLVRQEQRPQPEGCWREGTTILLRGDQVLLRLEAGDDGQRVWFGDQSVAAPPGTLDFRALIGAHLWRLARAILPPRVFELAARHNLPVRRVTVRDQRSRWGSCSRLGTISLNWRLVQMPDRVRDYVIWHELMHLRQMNHSPRFWREVAAVCPEFDVARRWLRQHREALR